MHEEEYNGEPNVELNENVQPQDCGWWGRHTELVHDNADDSDIGDEVEMGSVHSDKENEAATPHKIPFNPETNTEDVDFKCYMEFATIDLLRKTVREHFIHNNKEYILLANDRQKFRVKCKAEGCPWMFGWQLTSKTSSEYIQTWITRHFRRSQRTPNIQSAVIYRAKDQVRKELEGSVIEQYAMLEDYFKQLLETNPGTTAKLKCEMQGDHRIFQRCYVCLHACKEDFKQGCRPFIGLDGCFLKGYSKGILLAAIGIDASNSIFPVAYAITEKETTNS
ncbi:uncharacterized protein LOC115710774 [Cannabis sativa]|uniref:uncharacterized protein LOC115710774 n=1 Tax=Cannabis sativa TaxID=3483 RepID=UPI0029CA9A25|nr:uncharacterized protein LOC115710774 [Cannabis sativa]